MHRSGTSSLTWLLGQAGAALPIDPLPPQRDNPKGFWESQRLVAEHDRLLRSVKSGWSDIRALNIALLKPEVLAECRARIAAAVEDAWPNEPLIVIKDPRICRFVPLFADILSELGIDTRVVLALRSPESVAASLQARDELSADYGRQLWIRHMMEAERASRALPRVAVAYDALLEDWRACIPAISTITGRAWSPDTRQQATIDAYLQPTLRHHEPTATVPGGVLANTAERIWRGLNALTLRDDGETRRELTRAYDRFGEKDWLEGDTLYAEFRRLQGRVRKGQIIERAASPGALRVHVVARLGAEGPQSSAYIRLLRPLSDAVVADRVQVSLDSWGGVLPDCDVCVVQRAALPDPKAAKSLLETLSQRDVPLVVDLDDDFGAMSPQQIRAGGYGERIAALDTVLSEAKEIWFSSYPLAARYSMAVDRAVVIPNALDPILCRDWRRQAPPARDDSQTRFLYMGTGTHAEDFEVIRPHLDALWREREWEFDVTLIGIADAVTPASWLSHMQPPPGARNYPRFVEWLREQGPFDVGLAPLEDTTFNTAKSDIKLLDYSALGLRSLASDSPAYRADPAFRSALVTDWPTALREMLDQPEARRQQAALATAHTWLNRTTPHVAVAMLDRLQRLVAQR